MKVLDGYKVYVQVKDVMVLKRLGFTMPIDTYAVMSNIQNQTRLKKGDFVAFEDTSAIAFFKGIPWILDVGIYYYKSINEIEKEIKRLEHKILFLEEQVARSEEAQELNDELVENKYKLNQLYTLLLIKTHESTLPLPIQIKDVISPKVK